MKNQLFLSQGCYRGLRNGQLSEQFAFKAFLVSSCNSYRAQLHKNPNNGLGCLSNQNDGVESLYQPYVACYTVYKNVKGGSFNSTSSFIFPPPPCKQYFTLGRRKL